jgi:hypothetical protein
MRSACGTMKATDERGTRTTLRPSHPTRTARQVVGWVLAEDDRLDKPEAARSRVDSIALAVSEPVVTVERLVGSAIRSWFDPVSHGTNLRVGDRKYAC